jgi:1-acyl-sn-glycerol-3-phosphate acyltransferase
MTALRAYTRLTLVIAWVLLLFSLRLCTLPLQWIAPIRDRRIRRWIFQSAAKGVLRFLGMRVNVVGHAPDPPFFLVSNHLSFLDVFLLASQLGCVFVSKADLAQWPVFGFIARSMNTLFIDREKIRDTARVNDEIKAVLEHGTGIAIFPESVVSQENRILPFKPALLQSAVELNTPVHFACIRYETPAGSPPASEVAVWRDGVSFLEHFLGLAALPYYTATVTFGDTPISGTDRKQLAEDLHQAVSNLFNPLD